MTQMIVMCTDHHILICAGSGRQDAKHIAVIFLQMLNPAVQFHSHLRQSKTAAGVWVLIVKRTLELLQSLTAWNKQCVGDFAADGCGDNSAPGASSIIC